MRYLSVLVFLFYSITGRAQYKNDNVIFKTVYPQDLCRLAENDKEKLFLDVRSKGEFEDTSLNTRLNIGSFRHAVNINVTELGSRISEISAFKNKPVYVYCSHSQRSRRASKMLADSGFTNVININGGVTAIRQLPENDCAQGMLIGKSGYRIISLATLCNKISTKQKDLMMIDVRNDSFYRHISADAKANSLGHFKSAKHIPLDSLKKSLPKIPYTTEIVLIDINGDDASKAAVLFNEKNYKNVYVLIEGMDRVYNSDFQTNKCVAKELVPAVDYPVLGTLNFRDYYRKASDFIAVDLRSEEEFTGTHKDSFRNIGHLKNAINIPAAKLAENIGKLEAYRSRDVLLYSFGGSRDVFEAAKLLHSKGFKPVVLNGGLFNIRWTAANVQGYRDLAELVINIPAENL